MSDLSLISKEPTPAKKKIVIGLGGLLSAGSAMIVASWADIGLILQQHPQITIAVAGSAATCLYGWSLWSWESRKAYKRLQKEHEEEVRIHAFIEFRRGKRTGDKWVAFCPKCHNPAGHNLKNHGVMAACTANCGWSCGVYANDIPRLIDELPK